MVHENKIMADAARLAKAECVNYDKGMCRETDLMCDVARSQYTIHDGAMNCDYFFEAVLPMDKELNAAVWSSIRHDMFAPWLIPWEQVELRTNALKVCATCGKYFVSSSNRQKYCSACAVEAKRKRDANAARRKYWKERT